MSGLKELHIGSYRSIFDLLLERFGRMNILVGANNTGKTSILEAIGLAARPFDPGQWIQTVTNRDASGPLIDGLWGLFPGANTFNFRNEDHSTEQITLRAAFEKERRITAIATTSAETYTDPDRPDAEAQTEMDLDIDVEVDTAGHVHRHGMEFHPKARRIPVGGGVTLFPTFIITPITHRSTQQLVTHLSYVIDVGAKEKCVELLRIFDSDVIDLEISRPSGRDALRVRHRVNGIVDLATFGDGMRRAFAMSIALIRASNGVLLVDEIESAIHAKALQSVLPWLVRAAEAADVQIVATTHSLEAIDSVLTAFLEAKPETVVTYHLRRAEARSGSVRGPSHVARRYDLAGLRSLREEGLDIR